ncbi:hypothetical protein SLNWT_5033 [Streptomyces albus]|uniref:Uncharacterized protein n=1 Tax=Streptomyces albus (strain ATCC 21838 / DSM 41398 / FERM P-419 / JCM 4703 / NBRC 107858) TaxID=1081613 RepID=A0A0B5EUH5_STRA4|nr:hypothetical protein SLNWT_5033 [Streptomyces albus]AOU79713.1 hypothetical protein SLNHY_5022 [Streptomyces albus]AYN35436.1 hypothetical protein DUI70_4939 [Streptomyces albus]
MLAPLAHSRTPLPVPAAVPVAVPVPGLVPGRSRARSRARSCCRSAGRSGRAVRPVPHRPSALDHPPVVDPLGVRPTGTRTAASTKARRRTGVLSPVTPVSSATRRAPRPRPPAPRSGAVGALDTPLGGR